MFAQAGERGVVSFFDAQEAEAVLRLALERSRGLFGKRDAAPCVSLTKPRCRAEARRYNAGAPGRLQGLKP